MVIVAKKFFFPQIAKLSYAFKWKFNHHSLTKITLKVHFDVSFLYSIRRMTVLFIELCIQLLENKLNETYYFPVVSIGKSCPDE